MYKTIEISDPDFTDEIWQEYYRFLQRLQKKYKLNLRNADWKDLKRRYLLNVGDTDKFKHLLFFNQGVPFLFIDYYISGQEASNQSVYFGFHGDFDQLDSELLKMIFDWYISEFESRKINDSYSVFFNEHIWRLAESLGAVYLTGQDEYYLYHDKANILIMQNWLNNIPDQHPELRIEFFDETPESLIPELADHLNRGLRAMPQEETGGTPYQHTIEEFRIQEERCKKTNNVRYNYIIFDKDNKIVASSAIQINLNKTDYVNQLLTSVRKDYHGRGMAKWLKAKMYFKFIKDFPNNKAIITEMRTVNGSILHINEQMGFVLERTGREYKLTLDALKSGRKMLD